MTSALDELAAALREEGGLIAEVVADPGGAPAPHGDGAAGREYALVVEAVREGYLQHYGEGRVVRSRRGSGPRAAGRRPPVRARPRAPGRARATLEAVGELADLISLCAQSHAEGDAGSRRRGLGGRGRCGRPWDHTEHEAAKAVWRGAQ